MHLGLPELIIILIAIVLIWGPSKLIAAFKSTPEVIKTFSKDVGENSLKSPEDIPELDDFKTLIGVLNLLKNRIVQML